MRGQTATVSPGRALLALFAALAMALALVPGVAAAQEGEARSLDGGICDDPESEFPDIQSENTQQAAGCLADYGIARGFTDGNYRPGTEISREQMASFIVRKLDSADQYDLPPGAPPYPYTDRGDIAQAHVANVDMISYLGIAEGRDDGSFGPGDPVTRAQMAAFVVRQIEEMIDEELEGGDQDYFNDTEDNWAEEEINKLAHIGIVQGVGENNYNPAGHVTRGQMALFIARDIDYLVEEHEFTFTSVHEDEEEPAEEAEEGQYEGELVRINTTENWFEADVRLGDANEEDDSDVATFYYSEDDGDAFYLGVAEEQGELTEEEFECVVETILDEDAAHDVAIDYDTEEGSEFLVNTDADVEHCTEDEEENGEPEPAESGTYFGEVDAIETATDTLAADISAPPGTGLVLFDYFESDSYFVWSPATGPRGEVTVTEFECIVELILEEESSHFFRADYDDTEGAESASEFELGTSDDVEACVSEEE